MPIVGLLRRHNFIKSLSKITRHNFYERVEDIVKIIEEFKFYMIRKGKSEHTIEAYVRSVSKYISWYQKNFDKQFQKIHEENIIPYLSHLKQQRNKQGKLISDKTVNQHINGLRTFNKFLVEGGMMDTYIIGKNLFQKIQNPIASPAKFSKIEVDRFFQTILESVNKNGVQDGYRDFALAKLLALSGMRISEALTVLIEEIHLEAREIYIRNGKGGKSRTVLINSELQRILSKYIRTKRNTYSLAAQSDYLFLSRRSNKLDRKTVNKAFKKYSMVAGLNSSISPHDLRHYFCSMALENGLGIHEVANLAGHSSITTTSLYTNPTRENMLEKLNRL